MAFEIAPFGHINEWMSRIRAIGHGNSTPLSWMEALHIAADAVPAAPRLPQSFYEDPDLGTMVRIRADDYGQDPVEGKLIFLDANEVAISRGDPKIGEVIVHFPARVTICGPCRTQYHHVGRRGWRRPSCRSQTHRSGL